MDIREKIEKIMQVEKLNAVQFAAEIGIQSSTLSHILNERNKPSLDVLKKILNRFRTINTDWLILDIGSMYRTEKLPSSLDLFDSVKNKDFAVQSSITSNISNTESDTIQATAVNTFANQRDAKKSHEKVVSTNFTEKSIHKIIVYYSDNTFQEFNT